jgi:hypothetical protein
MRIRKLMLELIFAFFILAFPMIISAFGQDAFTLKVGEKNIFTDFNWHNTWIVNCAIFPDHPTNPCNFGYTQDNDSPNIQSANSDGNTAAVDVIAQPGSNGSSHAELGIKFSNINLNGYTISEARALPAKVTIKFTYYLEAKSVFGSAGAGINIMPLAPSWYHLINNPGGGEFGPFSAVATYDTNLGAIWGGVWVYLMSIAHTGVKDPLPTNSSGYAWVVINEISISSKCDFTSNEDGKTERCYGGVGIQCDGVIGVAPFDKDMKTCEVDGWVSAGSILHDSCCLRTNNTGYMCRPYNLFTNTCRKEWDEAVANTACIAVGAWRMWPHTFGPYFDPNTGDHISLRAPSGARVNPKYEYVCVTGRCIPDTKKKPKDKEKPKLDWDYCGWYCTCE